MKVVKGYKVNNFWAVMYSMVTITDYFTLRIAKKEDLRNCHHTKT